MKKVTVIVAAIALSITVFSCGRNNSQQGNTAKESKLEKTTAKKELIVSLAIGEERIALKNASIRNNAMNPGQKSNDYSIEATPEGTNENTDEVAFSLDFTTTGSGKATEAFMTLKKYKIINVSIQVEKIETKKGTYGGVAVTSLEGSFNGQLKKTNNMNFPTGDLINFKGTFKK